jgi:Na+/proline symporter
VDAREEPAQADGITELTTGNWQLTTNNFRAEGSYMDDQGRDEINISHIPVSGLGGLGLVAVAVGVYVGMPQLRWVGLASLVGGSAVGLTLIATRHKRARRAAETGGLILAAVVGVGLWLYFRN